MKLSVAKIEELRTAYSTINRVDPEGHAYQCLIWILDRCDQDTLEALSQANIKFVSKLAANRVRFAHHLPAPTSEDIVSSMLDRDETWRGKP